MLSEVSVYEKDLDKIVELVFENQKPLNGSDKFKELNFLARKQLLKMRQIAVDTPLLSYGEQPDPPIIKNIGKTILAEVLKRKLRDKGVKALNIHDVLSDDVFGSNSEVFKSLGLLGSNQCHELGKQTYTKAPVSGAYIVRSLEIIRAATEQDVAPFISELALGELALFGSGKERSIGEFNLMLRTKLEELIIPFKFRRLDLSEFENVLLQDSDTLQLLLEFSGYANGATNGEKGIYVVWKQQKEKGNDSGYRRYFVQCKGENAHILNPLNCEIVASTSLTDLLKDPRVYRLSLDASSRAALGYALTSNGVTITGGGSTYNECVSRTLVEQGFPQPLIAYISQFDFAVSKGQSFAKLLGKQNVVKNIIDNYKTIRNTDSAEFAKLVGGLT